MLRENALRKRLEAGRKSLGCWLFTNNPVSAEILGQAGYDFVIIDHEHGFGGLGDAVLQMQALQAFSSTVILRVPWNDPVYIKRALDIGAEGIMVPSVNNAEEARAAVAACRYPPAGQRGSATAVIRASGYGRDEGDYLRAAADVMVWCQIETPEAVASIGEIGAVEGVDCMFIGPNDLAAAMGHLGELARDEVIAAVAEAEKAIKATGRALAGIPFADAGWQDMFDRGYDIMAAGSDVSLLRNAASEQVNSHRAANG